MPATIGTISTPSRERTSAGKVCCAQYLPKEDGTEKDGWTASALKALIAAVEESNPGFHFDWDEKKLKDKVAGCLFRSEEWAFNGRTGWTTRPIS